MKLIVEVRDSLGEVDVYQYLKSDPEECRVVTIAQQAESSTRLAEVAKEMEKTVKAYYSKGKGIAEKFAKREQSTNHLESLPSTIR